MTDMESRMVRSEGGWPQQKNVVKVLVDLEGVMIGWLFSGQLALQGTTLLPYNMTCSLF